MGSLCLARGFFAEGFGSEQVMTSPVERKADGAILTALSNAVVQIVREYTGRGPTRARASIRDNVAVVLMQETLLKAEHSLINDSKAALVVEMRRSFQQTMRAELSAAVERITGRKVIAFMSDSHLQPDYSIEVFVLAPDQSDGSQPVT
jgi:uncharacterized protein YbcI